MAKMSEKKKFQISKNRDNANKELLDLQFIEGSNAHTTPTMSQPTSNAKNNILPYSKYGICLRGSELAIVPLALTNAIAISAIIITQCTVMSTIK